jgi:DNA-binding transcriptional MerR regulator
VTQKTFKDSFTIEEVSEIAGVNSFTLRNWEDRYQLFTPARDAKGRRIFSESDTMRAVVAAELTKRNYKISKVAADLQEAKNPYTLLITSVEGDAFIELRENVIESLLAFNVEAFQQNFMHLLGNYDIEFIADHFFYPVYRELEARKNAGTITNFQFQFCQHQLAARIFRLTGSLKVIQGKDFSGRVLVTGFPENQFEDSTLILYLVLERYGWQVIYGGPRTKIEDLKGAIKDTSSDLVILVGNNLSVVDYERYETELSELGVPVVVGGKLSLKLIASGRTNSAKREFASTPPGPFARLLKYKLADASSLL